MASGAVSVALQTIRDLLVDEFKFLGGVKDQVKSVEAKLTQMQAFLKAADREQFKDDRITNYVKETSRLAYRIENVLETYAFQVASRRQAGGIRGSLKRYSFILGEGKALHKVGSEIEEINTHLNNIQTSFEIWASNSHVSIQEPQNLNQSRTTYAHQVEEYFVGMKDDIRELVSLVTDEERSHRVISIYGMGGLGKTTLARKIYNHIEVKRSFKAFAWVSISQQFTTKNVLGLILKQLIQDQNKETIDKMEETELFMELYKVQKESNCLVVLDDLWKIEHWRCLSPAFPFAEANSKILITTRDKNLAEAEFSYPLSFLSEDEGWELLQKRAFAKKEAKDSEIDPKLEEVGRQIVLKCGKLPLAISTLGGILSQKPSLHDWQTVNKDVDFYLRMGEDSKDGYGAVLQVLALSYHELPYHLKPCFLHLGHFREDEDIDVEMLYQMWTAEGMVSTNYRGIEETLTDVAERYLLEMASRSMVQVELDEFSASRRVKSCRLHDLMRDFCLTRGKEVEFLKVLNLGLQKDPLPDSAEDHFRPFRCAIHFEYDNDCGQDKNVAAINVAAINMALEANGQLRSLLINSTGDYWVCFSFCRKMYDSQTFKFLRVLIFERYVFKGRILARGIEKLIHLRLLSFKRCLLDKLPSSISQLQYLQTLDLRVANSGEKNWIQVANVIWKLKGLKHLYLPLWHKAEKGKEKLRLFGLCKLETLVNFSNEDDEFRDLSELINLRCLRAKIVVNKNDNDNIVAEVLNYLNSNQNKLKKTDLYLELDIEKRILVPLQDAFACLNLHLLHIGEGKCDFEKLQPLNFCSNLIDLVLFSCTIEGDPMDFLGKLSNLRKLRLNGVKSVDKKVMICDANSFPKLISLSLWEVYNLEKWVVDEGAMPNLSYLHIFGCRELEMIPDGLRFVTVLKELKIWNMSEEFNQRVQAVDGIEGADYHKIRHVPLISIVAESLISALSIY